MIEPVDHLIHARWLITCEEQNQILENHTLAIKEGKILEILPSESAQKKYSSGSQHHYNTHAVMPGLINTHTHSAMNVFRGLADDLEFMDWLQNYIWPAEGKFVSQEMVFDGSLFAI